MLTSDENLVDINMEVQYRRANALDYAFNVYKPEDTLKEVSESAIREVIGRSKLDSVLESGRLDIVTTHQGADPAHARRLQDRPGSDRGQPAGRARAERSGAGAGGRHQGARGSRPPVARGAGLCERSHPARARQRGAAGAGCAGLSGRRKSPTPKARPSASSSCSTEYERAPGVTRDRLYLETIERVLKSSRKVILDTERHRQSRVPADRQAAGTGPARAARGARGDGDDRGHDDYGQRGLRQRAPPAGDTLMANRAFLYYRRAAGRRGAAVDGDVLGARDRAGDEVALRRDRARRLHAGPALQDAVLSTRCASSSGASPRAAIRPSSS